MKYKTEEYYPCEDSTTRERRKAYNEQQRKSRWYRNFEMEYNRKFRASAPPLRTNHRMPHTLFAPTVIRDTWASVQSIKASSLQFSSKFSSSESATLSPSSICSDKYFNYSIELNKTTQSGRNEVLTSNYSYFKKKTNTGEMQEHKRMEATHQEKECTASKEDFLLKAIAKHRKKSLAHLKLPRGLFDVASGGPDLPLKSAMDRREDVNIQKQSGKPVVTHDKKSMSLRTSVHEPKHFFLKMIVQKLLTRKIGKTNRVSRISFLERYTEIPKEAFLKLKVNQIIKQIRFINERQRLRELRRQINIQINTFRKKRAVISEIKLKSVVIQKHVGLICDFDDTRVSSDINVRRIIEQVLNQRARKALTCKEIQTRSRQIKFKSNVTDIIKTNGLKAKLMSEFRKSWSNARTRSIGCRKIIINKRMVDSVPPGKYIADNKNVPKQVEKRSYFANNPIIRSMYLKMLCNKEIRQRGLKKEMQRELLSRFRVVHLKSKLCSEVVEHARTVTFNRSNFSPVNRQKSVVTQIGWETGEQLLCVKEKKADLELFTNFRLKDKNNAIKTERLKFEINEHVEKLGVRSRIEKLKQRKGSVLKELALVDKKQIILKRRVTQEIKKKRFVKPLNPKVRKRQLDQMIRQHLLKSQVNLELCQRQRQRLLKSQLMQELRMVKLKMLVCLELKRVAIISHNKRAAKKINQRNCQIRIRQAYLKTLLVKQISIMGLKMRVTEEIKKRENSGTLIPKRMRNKELVLEHDDNNRFVNLDDVPGGPLETTGKTHYTNYYEFKEMLEDLKAKDRVNREIRRRKILRVRTEVDKRKAILIMEFKMRVAKQKCMIAMRQRARARKDHKAVCQEIRQRTNLGRCVQDIKSGYYYLRNVRLPSDDSSIVICKQQIHKRNVTTVIKQAGRKVQLNLEIVQRQNQCNHKALVVEEIKQRARNMKVCQEIRLRAVQRAKTLRLYRATVDEFKQRSRKCRVMKEIYTRQKQIYRKRSICTIIKQGGHKSRVNMEVRAFGKQKYLKKQINILIRQGGLKSLVQKEIRQLRRLSELKKQRILKEKVNLSIHQIAEAHRNKRKICTVVKQTGLKSRCNQEIRRQEIYLRRLPSQQQVRPLRSQQQVRSLEFNETTQQKQTENNSDPTPAFDDRDSVYGTKVSKKGIKIMELVDLITAGTKKKEQQEKEIRVLTGVLSQQKADFAALIKRVVADKDRLYQQLDDLKQENEALREIMAKQSLEVQTSDKRRQKKYMKRQQVSQLYQEIQEVGSGKMRPKSTRIQPRQNVQSSRFTRNLI
jgi:hypothetical protein